MSNKERAATLLTPNYEHCQRVHNGEGGDPCMFCEYDAEAAVERLADAGLLVPDLPAPDDYDYGAIWDQVFAYQEGPDWRDTKGFVAANAGAVEVVGNDTHIHTPDEARELAYALLAAANYSEDTE